MDTLYTFLDNTTHHKAKSVDFWGLMNSATKYIREFPKTGDPNMVP